MKAALRLTLVFLALPLCHAFASDEDPPRYAATWGIEGSGVGQFRSPTSLALDAAGNVYVADQRNDRIQKFTPRGRFVTQWGRSGDADSEFLFPTDIAVGPGGEVFVTDQTNSRIQVFDTSGVYLRKWGSGGTEPGQFSSPTGITVSGEGYVYVSDPANRRVQKFTADGELLAVWGPELPGEVTLEAPAGIASDNSGRIYVVDSKKKSLLEFTADGDLAKTWDPESELGVPLYRLVDVSLDAGGNIYLLDTGKGGSILSGAKDPRIVAFRKDGTVVTQFGLGGASVGALEHPSALAVGPTGWIYVADSGNNRVQVFADQPIDLWQPAATGAVAGAALMASHGSAATVPGLAASWGFRGSDPGGLKSPAAVAAGPNSAIYVVDRGNHRIQRWDQAGGFVGMWGRKGDAEGEFNSPADAAVDSDGSIFVADRGNHRIQVFDPDGNFLAAWGSKGSGEGQFRELVSLATDRNGHLYVVDTGNRRLKKFRTDGEFVASWGPQLTVDEKLEAPTGICTDGEGNPIVVDAGTNKIQKLHSDGTLLESLHLKRDLDLDVYTPVAIDIDSSGYLYILDVGRMPEPFKSSEDARLFILSPDDTLVARLGKNGADPGEFDTPSGLAVDPFNRIFVADSGNDRVQVFAWLPQGTVPTVATTKAEKPPRTVKEISLEVWRVFLDVDGDRPTTGLLTPATEWSLSNRISALGRLPFARLDLGSQQSETALGNPYVGIRFGPSNRNYTDIGIWLPLASEDNSSALFTGFISDVDRWEAYLPSTLSLQMESLGEIAPHSNLALGLRLGYTLNLNTELGGSTGWLPYGGWMKFLSRNVRVQGGLTGRLHLSFSGQGTSAVNRTQLLLAADFGTWRLRPGLALRFWLNGDFRELVPAVLGLTFRYDFRR
jgi:DNA-binding beta-propeller fold protein YncE